MEHQPFESWLLDDLPLTPEQRRDLRQHTLACARCAALETANFSLRAASMAAPAPGFAQRFALRLAAQRRLDRRRALIGGIFLALAASVILIYSLLPLLPYLTFSPIQIFVLWVNALISFSAAWHSAVTISEVFGRLALQLLPAKIWAAAFLSLGGLVALWTALFRPRAAQIPQPEEA
ncbi:MAG: hypothetical protein OHK0031_13890 [Anaerolineales bacterium]